MKSQATLEGHLLTKLEKYEAILSRPLCAKHCEIGKSWRFFCAASINKTSPMRSLAPPTLIQIGDEFKEDALHSPIIQITLCGGTLRSA